jgi:hypothetical protein
LEAAFILFWAANSAARLIGSALSTTSSVTPGVDMGSISVTSARRGWFKIVCIMVSLGALWPLSSME